MRRTAPSNPSVGKYPRSHSADLSDYGETENPQESRTITTPTHSAEQSARHELQLFTPSAAAELLSVKESWLRRKAGTRSIPCTFLGRHLRFSVEDLRAITHQGSQPLARRRGRPRSR
jgi:excisionase family DNA binding protein